MPWFGLLDPILNIFEHQPPCRKRRLRRRRSNTAEGTKERGMGHYGGKDAGPPNAMCMGHHGGAIVTVAVLRGGEKRCNGGGRRKREGRR